MIVDRHRFPRIVKELSGPGIYGIDTETTGLFESDSLFSIIISSALDNYYFNFQKYSTLQEELTLPREWIRKLVPIFNKDSIFSIANPKFDMRMLAKEGLNIAECVVHSIGCAERILRNNYFGSRPYGLDSCAKRRGFSKMGEVEDYINKNKLYTQMKIPGKKRVYKAMHFDKVPFDVITKYGENDGFLHRAIGVDQLEQLAKLDENKLKSQPSMQPLYENEMRVVKTCYRMERRGVLIDPYYCTKALSYEEAEQEACRVAFLKETDEAFYVDSNIVFAKVFDRLGLDYPRNAPTENMIKKAKEKGIPARKVLGNPTFRAEVLESFDHPLANLITSERQHAKYKEYYSSFLFHAQENIIHANIRNSGTNTGRMSMSDPTLHNVPKEDEPEDQKRAYQVRGSFIPRPSHLFGMLDYDQMEYRMMMDYAGEKKVIDAILQGEDVHQVVAELIKKPRKQAKNINFGILYGQGIPALAKALGISEKEATDLRRFYYSKLPKVKALIETIRDTGKNRGNIWNWFGRKCYIDDPGFAYKLPNHLIQGGCADVMKIAMNKVDQMLLDKKTRSGIAIQVHDELVNEIHENEIELLPEIKKIMETVYPARNGMLLTAGIDHSFKSWAYRDKIEGMPT